MLIRDSLVKDHKNTLLHIQAATVWTMCHRSYNAGSQAGISGMFQAFFLSVSVLIFDCGGLHDCSLDNNDRTWEGDTTF